MQAEKGDRSPNDLRKRLKSLMQSDSYTDWVEAVELMRDHLPESVTTFDACDSYFGLQESALALNNFLYDLEEEMHNEGIDDLNLVAKRAEICHWVYTHFKDEKDLNLCNFRSQEAESLWQIGHLDEAKKLFEELISLYPKFTFGYIHYGDCYWISDWSYQHGPDYDRAEAIYRMALDRPGLDDVQVVRERLNDLLAEKKAPEEREEIRKIRLEQIAGRKPLETPVEEKTLSRPDDGSPSAGTPKAGDDIFEILEAFRTFDGVYKREAVDGAIACRNEITPHLIGILERVLSDPAKAADTSDLYDQTYALYLLAHFREPAAHDVIVDLFGLPGDLPDELFGHITTEDLPIILYRTCGGSLDRIKFLASKDDADPYCRASALRAIEFAVADGLVSREEILSFLEPLLSEAAPGAAGVFLSYAARTVCNLYPEGWMEKIKEGFDNEWFDPWVITFGDFERALGEGKDKCLETIRKELNRRSLSLDDLHRTMSSWACFKPQERVKVPGIPAAFPARMPGAADSEPAPASRKKTTRDPAKAKAKKKKRKLTKASKRKNR